MKGAKTVLVLLLGIVATAQAFKMDPLTPSDSETLSIPRTIYPVRLGYVDKIYTYTPP